MPQTHSGGHFKGAVENVIVQNTVFTIGHSTHPPKRFVTLLHEHHITAICDVRSKPYSRFNSQFNREELKEFLRQSGIKYVFMGKELGARSDDSSCYENGKVLYDRLARTDLFRLGLDRVQNGMKCHRLALMCAEKDPIECHRAILVARHLAALGIDVHHIHADSKLESHGDALSRLLRLLNLLERNMFQSREELLAEAYSRQGERIAYSSSEASSAGLFASGAAG